MTLFEASWALLIIVAHARVHAEELPNPLSDNFIDLINREQSSWRAGRNFAEDTPMDYIKNLMGVIKGKRSDDKEKKVPQKTHDLKLIKQLPENFDSRDKWPNCPSLNEIRDQGSCGSCWALATVESITDRYCIFSNGTIHFHASAEDMVACSGLDGCNGDNLYSAFESWITHGVVSGGAYNSSQGCMPYQIEPCEHNVQGKRKQCFLSTTPECIKKCRVGYGYTYVEDKRYGKEAHSFVGEDNIRAELYKNGPLVASFIVYADFLNYKEGVYRHHKGDKLGFHAVKLIGWGVENDVKYWLIANSWNTDWGDKGFFKIVRGENHCGIEEGLVGGIPRL